MRAAVLYAPKDLRIERHDIQNGLLLPPPANWNSFAGILDKAAPAEPLREINVSGV